MTEAAFGSTVDGGIVRGSAEEAAAWDRSNRGLPPIPARDTEDCPGVTGEAWCRWLPLSVIDIVERGVTDVRVWEVCPSCHRWRITTYTRAQSPVDGG